MINCEKIIFERNKNGYYKVRLINIPITTDEGVYLCNMEYPKVACNIGDLVTEKGNAHQNIYLDILLEDDEDTKQMFSMQILEK